MLSANQILKKEVNDEVYFWYADKHRSLLRVDIMILGVCIKHAQSTQNKKFAYLCNISRKAWRVKLSFCLQINMEVFYKLIVSLWVFVGRHAQSTQNNKFTISL